MAGSSQQSAPTFSERPAAVGGGGGMTLGALSVPLGVATIILILVLYLLMEFDIMPARVRRWLRRRQRRDDFDRQLDEAMQHRDRLQNHFDWASHRKDVREANGLRAEMDRTNDRIAQLQDQIDRLQNASDLDEADPDSIHTDLRADKTK